MNEIKDLLSELKFINTKIDSEILSLQAEDVLSEFFMTCPFPMWVKDTRGHMVAINHAYTSRYDVTLADYAGNLDDANWEQQAAVNFGSNDIEVLETGVPRVYIEAIDSPSREELIVLKFPVNRDTEVIGVGGIAIYLPITTVDLNVRN